MDDKYVRYYGVIVFAIIIVLTFFIGYKYVIEPAVIESHEVTEKLEKRTAELNTKLEEKKRVERRIANAKSQALAPVEKRVYAPIEADLGSDSLFFTLYSDVIEKVHSNSIKIKSLEYEYNPEDDAFVKAGSDTYFVCRLNMELVSNYINLGKFVEDIYQYPYYVKINSIKVKPYEKDKKILISNVSLNLYAKTEPEEETAASSEEEE